MNRYDPPRLDEFRCAEAPAVPSRERLDQLHDRILAQSREGEARRFLPLLVAATVLAGSVTVVAETFLFRPAGLAPKAETVGASRPVERERRRQPHMNGPAVTDVGGDALAPAQAAEPAAARAGERAPMTKEPRPSHSPTVAMSDRWARAERPSAAGAASTPGPFHSPPPSASAVLREGLEQLRAGHNPGAALAIIDAHRAELESGSLAAEGDLVRLEALLALARRDEAAHLLDAMEVPPTRHDLRLLRGELRAGQGRCADALPDFHAARRLRGGDERDEVDERALHGLAACLSKLGEPARARAALQEYIARYPAGAFTDESRRALGD